MHLTVAALAGLGATYLFGYWSIPVWLAVAFVFQFFRDPQRTVTADPGAVVAPASGKIVAIGEVPNAYDGDQKALKVSIFMNVFSVHSNLIPVGGTIVSSTYFPGKFINAAVEKSSKENERNAIVIRSRDGHRVVCVQIAGLIARRILCYVKTGDQVPTGQRYGFIRFGSRVDLYLPRESRLTVRLGQWVTSGNDTVGYLPGY